MRTVRDDEGDTYLLIKQSNESSRVRDPETGEERYLPNEELADVTGESPLETAASAISPEVRRLLTAVHDDRALGLLVEFTDRGPISVVDLLDAYDLCESDLHGLLAEFRAAGLITETEVAGHRGYDATETATKAISILRDTDSGS